LLKEVFRHLDLQEKEFFGLHYCAPDSPDNVVSPLKNNFLHYSSLFNCILFYSILFYFNLFHSIIFHSILFYFIPFHPIPRNACILINIDYSIFPHCDCEIILISVDLCVKCIWQVWLKDDKLIRKQRKGNTKICWNTSNFICQLIWALSNCNAL